MQLQSYPVMLFSLTAFVLYHSLSKPICKRTKMLSVAFITQINKYILQPTLPNRD